MSDLWSELGYDAVVRQIALSLRASGDINVVEGPPGVGKSWVARGLGAMWESSGGSTVVAEGDSLRSGVSFYPLGFAMAGLSSGWRSFAPAVATVATAGEHLIGTGGIITTTVAALAKVRPSRRRARALFLGDAEQGILFELERLTRTRPLLLVADNLHWWDARSLELLGRLRESRMQEAFPFLAELRVLAVQTTEPYQSIANPQAHDALLAPQSTHYFACDRVPRDRFKQVLGALGATPEPSDKVADAVYALTGGHLALASRCVEQIVEGRADELLSAGTSSEFVGRLLSERMRSLGPLGAEAVALLEVAAVLGLTFRRDEVTCASGAAESATARLLRYCRDEAVVELTEGLGKFAHDVYRQHFLSLATFDRTGIHERLDECLRSLRPSEYELRCANAAQAEQPRRAATLAVQAALQAMREGRSWRDLPPEVVDAIRDCGFLDIVESLSTALDALKLYRFSACLATLDGLPRDLPKSLLAEADYIRAMCLMSTRSETDRAAGRALLDVWSGVEEDEPELGIRLMQLQLYGLTHLEDKEPARQLEGRLRRALIDRVSFDGAAADVLYSLDRASGSLYQPDVAVVRNREAVAHYGPAAGQNVLRRPVEYYRCLVNFGASLICNARYAEACDVHSRVRSLVAGYASDVFPRTDYPYMNELLAEYRLGGVHGEEAVARQRAIVADSVAGDRFYGENALAVYLALSEHREEALELFEQLEGEIVGSRQEPEPSMLYLIRANRCVTRFLAGDVTTARSEWQTMTPLVERIAYVTRPFLVRRHALLANVLAGEPMSPRAFDECLVVSRDPEFGPLWDNYGRGFRMPEVEFWREN